MSIIRWIKSWIRVNFVQYRIVTGRSQTQAQYRITALGKWKSVATYLGDEDKSRACKRNIHAHYHQILNKHHVQFGKIRVVSKYNNKQIVENNDV